MQVRKLVVLAVFAVLLAGMGAATQELHYRFNESSSPAIDFSGNNNDGTWNGAFTSGVSGVDLGTGDWGDGLAHSFDGTEGYVDAGDVPNVQGNAFSVFVWVKPSTGASDTLAVITKGGATEGSGDASWNLMHGQSNSRYEVRLWDTASGSRNTFTFGGFPADGKLRHIGFTYDGSTVRFYNNGTLNDTAAYAGGIQDSTDSLMVAKDPVWGKDYNGMLDEPHIYNQTLSGSDVNNLFTTNQLNQAPVINNNFTEPASPKLNDVVNITANVTGPDGDAIANVSATVLEDGVQIADKPMPATTGDLFKAVDAFTADEINVWYNITITADDGTATSTSEINFRVEDDAPTLTVKDPKNQSYTSIPPYNVLLNDTDDVPGETFNWAVWVNNGLEDSGSGAENLSISGFLNTSQQGFNTFKVNATDNAGNLASQTVNYTFDNVPPVVNIDSPTGNVTVDDARSVDLNFTVTDATSAVNGCIINPNNGTGNFSQATCQNTTLIYTSNGDKTVEIWANDTLNNTRYAFSDFNIRIENRLRAFDADTNNLINSFTAEFSNGTAAFDTTRSTTSGSITPFTRNLPTGPAVNVDVSADGYNDASTSININDTTAFDVNVTLSPVSISYEVFDESTNDYLDNPAFVTVNNGTEQNKYPVLNAFKSSTGDFTDEGLAYDRNKNTFAVVNPDASGTSRLEYYIPFDQKSDNTLSVKARDADGVGASGELEIFNENSQSFDTIASSFAGSSVTTHNFTINNTNGQYDSGIVRISSTNGLQIYETWNEHLTVIEVPTNEVLFGDTTVRVNDLNELNDYRPRTFFVNVTNQDRNVHTYLLKRSEGITASVKTEDELEQAIQGARVTLTREFGFDTAVIAQRETASGGTATFFVDPDEVYGLNASKTGFESFSGTFNGQPYQFSPFVITLESLADIALPDSRFEVLGLVDYSCTQFNVSLFNCSYSHSSSSISSLNLSVEENKPVQNVNVCDLGSTLGTDELRCTGLNITNTSYQYVFSATLTDGNSITLESGFLSTVQNNYGDFGLFAFLMLLAVITLGALWLPEVTILVAALTVPLAFFTGILAVSPTAVISLIAVALILLWRLSN